MAGSTTSQLYQSGPRTLAEGFEVEAEREESGKGRIRNLAITDAACAGPQRVRPLEEGAREEADERGDGEGDEVGREGHKGEVLVSGAPPTPVMLASGAGVAGYYWPVNDGEGDEIDYGSSQRTRNQLYVILLYS